MSSSRNTDDPLITDDLPVTVAVSRQVKPGWETAFEEVIEGIITAASTFEGYSGANVFRPSDPTSSEYRLILRFDRMSDLHRWEQFVIRRQWLERADSLALDLPKTQVLTGLETWFTLSARGASAPPPRYKMVAITCLVIFPLINGINTLLGPLLNPLPSLLRSLFTTVLLVSLMTYVVMPRITRLFARWLYPKSKR